MPLRQSFAWWSFAQGKEKDPSLLGLAASIGFTGVDFLDEELWPAAREAGLALVVADGHAGADTGENGFNDRANHHGLRDEVRRNIEKAVREEVGHLAVAFGNRHGLSDADAVSVCAEGLAPVAAEAEEAGVGLLLEPLNSTVDHPGHQCDQSWLAFSVARQVSSPALRILYDAYHMQIMEGNLLTTIGGNLRLIGHVHVAGVPGRGDLDHRQEVNWPAVARLLRKHDYPGFVGHEYFPEDGAATALARSFTVFAGG
ncbi:TIM barrel protein [Streptomyces sp. NPDC059853]|uniref:TIM barrel protein n=1 Tax=Streptomyces sp. NPDC059853 TaxID=3346973 RepID=UPI00366797A9